MKNLISNPFRSGISAIISVLSLGCFAAPSASAATRFWSGNGTSQGGGGTWDTTLLRWGSVAAGPYTLVWNNAANDTAEFNTATGTATLGTDITVGGINQKTGSTGVSIAEGAGFNSITLGSATTIFSVAASVTVGRTLNVNAEVTGANNLSIQGPTTTAGGDVNLNRVNTFTGTLSIDDTTLRIGNGPTAAQLNSGNYSAAISITSTGTFGYSSSLNQTLGGVISGAGKLNKNTAGSTLTLTNSNSYSGATTINGGKLVGVVGGHHQSSDVTLNNVATATYGVSITDNTKSWTCKSLACAAAGTLEFNFGAVTPSDSVSPLVVTNLAAFTATPLVSVVVSAGLSPGIYPLMTWGSTSGTIPATPQLTVSNVAVGTTPTLSVSGNTLLLVISSTASSVVKEDNANPLNAGNSWVGGNAPTTTEVAKWNGTVMSPNTTNLGADTTWTGITIENPNGLVTIDGTHTLTLGAATVDIDMGTADTAGLTLNCPLALGAANIWNVAATRTLTLGGKVSGAFGITKLGEGTAILSSTANDYTGNTTVTAGTLRLGANNVIPHGAGGVAGNVTVNGMLDLNGKSESINGLSGSGNVDNTDAATSTFTVGNNSQTTTFNGVIKSTTGNVNLTKTGNGTLTLGGANTFTGSVTINASTGTLVAGNVAPLANVTGITMGGGTTLRSSVDGAVINAPITLGGVGTTANIHASTFDGSGSTLVPFTLGGAISGDANLTISGVEATNSYGLIILNGASTYTGTTLITTVSEFAGGPPANANIFVRLGVDNALPTTTVVTLDGGDGGGTGGRFCEINLNGKNQTLAGLQNVTRVSRNQEVYNTNATASTLTINNTDPFIYSGKIGGQLGPTGANGDNLGLTKSGAGTFTLAGANTYTGATTITGGTLALAASTSIATSSAVSLGAAGTLDTSLQATYAIPATQPLAFGIDATASGTSGKITAAGLNITDAVVTYNITGTPDDAVYVLATYTSLTGANFASVPAPPVGYTLQYAYQGNKIALVQNTGSTYASWIAGFPGVGILDGVGDDPDFDGIDNGVEMVLGGNPATGMDTALMPTLELVTDPPSLPAGNYLLFTYRRTAISEAALVAATCETDTDLVAPWTPAVNAVSGVVIQEDLNYLSFTPAAPTNTDRVRVYVPRAANTKLFGRLNVVIP